MLPRYLKVTIRKSGKRTPSMTSVIAMVKPMNGGEKTCLSEARLISLAGADLPLRLIE